ncbi:flagellar hook protein FlgE [Pelagibius sp. Alg239-R121]|uniref:flagellar hook protein FlgE n=1 Tax=Pelagibius sp. Alg239-R121 TaxID=2993448 RepID=UPI0024A7932B|nr:flagellar hook protein FlgE [Pelagibius sp. Alg239-R121]
MSLYGALYAGVSGLSAQSNAIGIISDNIANVNTVGYKGTSARFSTLVTQQATQSLHSPGGVKSQPFNHIDQQGLLQATASSTDIAIAGNGFFVVNESATPGVGDEYLFTRAGSFFPDQNGDLVNTAGFFLQGYDLGAGPATTSASTVTGLQTVNVANLAGTATPTSTLEIGLNLPSTAAVADTETLTIQVYDSLGNSHDVDMVFAKTATNAWSITPQNPTLTSSGVASGTITSAAGSITFNGDGTPATITMPTVDITWTVGGANNSSITVNAGTLGQTDGITQFAGEFTVSKSNQNGVSFGNFAGVSIDEQGIVTALFDNGETLDIYHVPVAIFQSPNGLSSETGNVFQQTSRSGPFLLNLPQVGGAGVVAPSSLEASTVDLANEFTNMIVVQRAYSASAEIITTADEMLEELIRISR